MINTHHTSFTLITVLLLIGACSKPNSKTNQEDIVDLSTDTIVDTNIQMEFLPEPIEEEVSYDSIGRPSKPVIENTSIDLQLLFGVWASEHSYPNASFSLDEDEYYIADYDGDGSIPYILRGDSLTVFFEYGKQTTHIALPSPNLLIMTSKSGEYYYERFNQETGSFNERHPFAKKTNNQLSQYQKVTVSNEEFLEHQPDGGGELTGYFENGFIKKIILSVGVSIGITRTEFYYEYSRLFYVTETFKQFLYDEETSTFDYSNTEITFHGQYLFEPAFDYETTGHNRFENDELDTEVVLREESTNYAQIIKSKSTNNQYPK